MARFAQACSLAGTSVGLSQPEEAASGHGAELVPTLDVGDVEEAAVSGLCACRDWTSVVFTAVEDAVI